MSDAFKKQMCNAGGTLAGYLLARSTGAKEIVPYTVLGGLVGFAIGESLVNSAKKATELGDEVVAGLPPARRKKTSYKPRNRA